LIKKGGGVYSVCTDAIKTTVYGRLAHNKAGPGYIHFNTRLTPDLYEPLTSERQRIRYVRGHAVYEWTKKSSARNEALDCVVYAYAALNFLYQRYNKKTIFEQFSKTCANVSIGANVVSIDTAATQAPAQRNRRKSSNSNFINTW